MWELMLPLYVSHSRIISTRISGPIMSKGPDRICCPLYGTVSFIPNPAGHIHQSTFVFIKLIPDHPYFKVFYHLVVFAVILFAGCCMAHGCLHSPPHRVKPALTPLYGFLYRYLAKPDGHDLDVCHIGARYGCALYHQIRI